MIGSKISSGLLLAVLGLWFLLNTLIGDLPKKLLSWGGSGSGPVNTTVTATGQPENLQPGAGAGTTGTVNSGPDNPSGPSQGVGAIQAGTVNSGPDNPAAQ